MSKIKVFFKKGIEIKLLPSFVIMLLGSILIMVNVVSINDSFLDSFYAFATQKPMLILLNYLPILTLILLLFLIFNKAVFSTIVTYAIFIILAFINSEKIRLRQDPLFPTDISLVTELAGIAKNFTPRTLVIYAVLILGSIAFIILSFFIFKTEKIPAKNRIAGLIAVIVAFLLCNSFLYKNETLYANFPVEGNQYFEVNQYGSKGFIYSFMHKSNTMSVKAPKGYDKKTFVDLESSFKDKNEEYSKQKNPHVIMVMGEAFSDLSKNDNLDFTRYGDPLENWNNITSSPNTISGHIIVPNYGGGTSDTEFDVLTGVPTRYINNSSTSYSLIRKNIDALPRQLKNIGYNSIAIHPGYSWFYNRANVYNYMGFEKFVHLESFQGKEKYSGGYIADKYATDNIIKNFEEHIATSLSPLFEFCVTIQNHGPYDEKYETVEKTFDTNIDLTAAEETMLNSYFMGVKDADEEIARLTDYFSESKEPVVLVYFGDHLPGFSNGMDFFDILDYNIDPNGTSEQVLNIYKTPFLIWQNDVAKEMSDFSSVKETLNLPPSSTISSNYLGSMMLELMGINNISPLYDFSNELRKDLPVLTANDFMTSNGEYITDLTQDEQLDVNIIKSWVYYKMFQ